MLTGDAPGIGSVASTLTGYSFQWETPRLCDNATGELKVQCCSTIRDFGSSGSLLQGLEWWPPFPDYLFCSVGDTEIMR